jgi:hypothetical protein
MRLIFQEKRTSGNKDYPRIVLFERVDSTHLQQSNRYLQICVSDNGIGFAKTKARRYLVCSNVCTANQPTKVLALDYPYAEKLQKIMVVQFRSSQSRMLVPHLPYCFHFDTCFLTHQNPAPIIINAVLNSTSLFECL